MLQRLMLHETAPTSNNNPRAITTRVDVSSSNDAAFFSVSARSPSQCHAVWNTTAEMITDDPSRIDGATLRNEREHRQRDHEHEQLAQFDADVERKQRHAARCDPANCSSDASMNEKPKPCTSPNRPRQPTALQVRPNDVLHRHIQDRRRDQGFDQRREPVSRRYHAVGGGDQGDRVRDRERGDDADEPPVESAKRQDQTQQERADGRRRPECARTRIE